MKQAYCYKVELEMLQLLLRLTLLLPDHVATTIAFADRFLALQK